MPMAVDLELPFPVRAARLLRCLRGGGEVPEGALPVPGGHASGPVRGH